MASPPLSTQSPLPCKAQLRTSLLYHVVSSRWLCSQSIAWGCFYADYSPFHNHPGINPLQHTGRSWACPTLLMLKVVGHSGGHLSCSKYHSALWDSLGGREAPNSGAEKDYLEMMLLQLYFFMANQASLISWVVNVVHFANFKFIPSI